VYVFESSKYLIEEELSMIIGEGLVASDDAFEIGLHQVAHQIDVLEVLLRRRL
jgi:hypothetical protein